MRILVIVIAVASMSAGNSIGLPVVGESIWSIPDFPEILKDFGPTCPAKRQRATFLPIAIQICQKLIAPSQSPSVAYGFGPY
jgi:hypothetical protein